MSLTDELAPEQTSDIERLEELVAGLHAQGIDFRVDRGRVTVGQPDRDRETSVDLGKQHIRLGILSDTHQGSRFEQLTALRSFYAYGDKRKVDAFVHVGDATQGSHRMHLGMELELHAYGADAQVDYVAATYPHSRRAKTYIIGGNHDDSFLKDGGVNVVRRICDMRDDFVYAGQDAAYLQLGPLRIYMVHPDGGGSYAKSYKPQKIAESLPLEEQVRLLLLGHYHVYGSFRQKDTHALMVPCFQSQYAWLARKALHPDIGGLIVDIYLDDAGRIARLAHEFVSYTPLADDWDNAASLAVSRGWSPHG